MNHSWNNFRGFPRQLIRIPMKVNGTIILILLIRSRMTWRSYIGILWNLRARTTARVPLGSYSNIHGNKTSDWSNTVITIRQTKWWSLGIWWNPSGILLDRPLSSSWISRDPSWLSSGRLNGTRARSWWFSYHISSRHGHVNRRATGSELQTFRWFRISLHDDERTPTVLPRQALGKMQLRVFQRIKAPPRQSWKRGSGQKSELALLQSRAMLARENWPTGVCGVDNVDWPPKRYE